MSGEEVLRIKPQEAASLIAEGRMQVVTAAPEQRSGGDPLAERAREILGKDFLGIDAVRNLEAKLNGVGQNIEFVVPEAPPIPYTDKDLELARQNGEMLILRVGSMQKDGRENPVTLINFRELFRADPLGRIDTPFYSFRPEANDWYKDEDFATRAGEIQLSWALVTKEVLAESKGKNHEKQTEVMKKHANELKKKGASNTDFRRRTPTEAAWDTLLYYVNNEEQLLSGTYDWTNTQSSDGYLVGVGYFGSVGVLAYGWNPDRSDDILGVCLSR